MLSTSFPQNKYTRVEWNRVKMLHLQWNPYFYFELISPFKKIKSRDENFNKRCPLIYIP